MRIIVNNSTPSSNSATNTPNPSNQRPPDPTNNSQPRIISQEERSWLNAQQRLSNTGSSLELSNENNNNSTQTSQPYPRRVKKSKTEMGVDEGYNSSDEQQAKSIRTPLTKDQIQTIIKQSLDEYEAFSGELKKKGMIIRQMAPDGNCLFRSVADQIYGDQEMHDQVRERCINYMRQERDHYSQFVTEDFEAYLARKRQDRCFGNNLEIQAIGELYNRPIEIYEFHPQKSDVECTNIFHNQYQTDNAPIRLSYHNGNHYNSVVDPNNPTVGVGLGLPGLEPGLADKMQIKDAIEASESNIIEDELLETMKAESEAAQTEQEIEAAIIAQSEWELEQSILEASRREYWDSVVRANRNY